MSDADGPLAILLDNPILTKHRRSRLRPGATGSWAAIIFVACVSIVGGYAYSYGGLGRGGWELQLILGLQVFILGLAGGFQISGAAASAREIGIFEYHRISPLPPSWIALGFLLGAPIREYLLAAITVPFAYVCA